MTLSQRSRKIVQIVLLVAMLPISIIILMYYWNADSFEAIKYVPMRVMVLCIVYVLLQVAKRYVTKIQNWWDWLYYIGLLAVMIPTLIATEDKLTTYEFLTDYGTTFLILPLILDAVNLLKHT